MVTIPEAKARVATTSHRRPAKDPKPSVKKFFKMILPSTIKSNMMRIPPRFVKLHRSKIYDVVTLETPAGFKRSIKLKRIGTEIWFHEGWTEFAEAHSIEIGNFLMFELKAKSSFRVTIFDASASEISYPLDEVDISDSDDEVINVADKVFHCGNSEHQLEKKARDIDIDSILHELDGISSVQVLKEEEQDKRAFKG